MAPSGCQTVLSIGIGVRMQGPHGTGQMGQRGRSAALHVRPRKEASESRSSCPPEAVPRMSPTPLDDPFPLAGPRCWCHSPEPPPPPPQKKFAPFGATSGMCGAQQLIATGGETPKNNRILCGRVASCCVEKQGGERGWGGARRWSWGGAAEAYRRTDGMSNLMQHLRGGRSLIGKI